MHKYTIVMSYLFLSLFNAKPPGGWREFVHWFHVPAGSHGFMQNLGPEVTQNMIPSIQHWFLTTQTNCVMIPET